MNIQDSLTEEQIQHIRSQQSKAETLVTDPSSIYYEPHESKRHTACRILMRKWEEEKATESHILQE